MDNERIYNLKSKTLEEGKKLVVKASGENCMRMVTKTIALFTVFAFFTTNICWGWFYLDDLKDKDKIGQSYQGHSNQALSNAGDPL